MVSAQSTAAGLSMRLWARYDVPVIFCPPEEMIWSKAFVMERERYDGADARILFVRARRVWTGDDC
jgi:hypothetical protein